MHYKKLAIISDTALYKLDGKWFGFNAVVNEINLIESNFDKIIWIGFNRKDLINNPTIIPIESNKIKVIALNNVGGKGILNNLKIILFYPLFFFIILKNIWKAQVIHTRAPSHPALIAILLSFLFKNKIWWNKFAGSWNASTLPFFYKVQRNILIKAKHTKVTMNGFWDNQPKHCLSFENPCLTQEDIKKGKEISKTKHFDNDFIFSFVGRLEDAKGVTRIIEALRYISGDKINEVHFIGDGSQKQHYIKETSFLKNKVFFHGFLSKNDVHDILAKSHFFLLPSDSEGFPKVISEACCYGTIPVVSDVGSIPHYINSENGFLWNSKESLPYSEILETVINEKPENLKHKSENCVILAELFTFEKYKKNLNQLLK